MVARQRKKQNLHCEMVDEAQPAGGSLEEIVHLGLHVGLDGHAGHARPPEMRYIQRGNRALANARQRVIVTRRVATAQFD